MSKECKGHAVIIAVDPGFGGTGICMMVGGKLYKFTNVKSGASGDERYIDVACKCARHVLSWISDLRASARHVDETYVSFVDIVIESPHAMAGKAGHAALMRGDIFKVAKLAGAIGALISVYTQAQLEDNRILDEESKSVYSYAANVRLHYPEVWQWKGQTSKDTTKRRVLRDVVYAHEYIKDSHYKLSDKYPDHVFDAVGIGMWFYNLKHTGTQNENKEKSFY